MSRFLLLSRGFFRVAPLTLYELLQCRRIREDFSQALMLQGETTEHARELAGAACLCYFSLKPVFARKFHSPEQLLHALTLKQLQSIAAKYPEKIPEQADVETGVNISFTEEGISHGSA